MTHALDSASGPGPDADDIECTRERTIAGIHRCLATLLTQVSRDYERCGKAACARSRRCRGFTCEPARESRGTETRAVR